MSVEYYLGDALAIDQLALKSASVTWPDDEFSAGETVPIDIDGDIVWVLFDGDEIATLETQQKWPGRFLYPDWVVEVTVITMGIKTINNKYSN